MPRKPNHAETPKRQGKQDGENKRGKKERRKEKKRATTYLPHQTHIPLWRLRRRRRREGVAAGELGPVFGRRVAGKPARKGGRGGGGRRCGDGTRRLGGRRAGGGAGAGAVATHSDLLKKKKVSKCSYYRWVVCAWGWWRIGKELGHVCLGWGWAHCAG